MRDCKEVCSCLLISANSDSAIHYPGSWEWVSDEVCKKDERTSAKTWMLKIGFSDLGLLAAVEVSNKIIKAEVVVSWTMS